MSRALAFGLSWALLASAAPPGINDALIQGEALPAKLSEFRFFTGGKPNARVEPYALNTPLFSDYAEKYRYMYVPAGQKARYSAEGVLDFPVGSALIKSFGYKGAGDPIETRVLLKRARGWVALPYVWNGDDAELKRGGKRLPVSFADPSGKAHEIGYAVPNANQCKECHQSAGALVPIGPKARNLNDGRQLQRLVAAGLLDRAPADAPRLARWDGPEPVAARARAYLDVNCGHCHSRAGMASNSGLYLTNEESDPIARGRLKRPVAAGRGSGGHEFAIDPGHPERSILLHRMATTEPGVAMPELGRALVHEEGVALVRKYIEELR